MNSKYDKDAMNGKIMLKEMTRLPLKEMSLVFPARTVPLHSMLTSCGHSRRNSTEYNWHGLKRGRTEFVLWQYTISGLGRLEYEGKSFDMTPGRGMLLHIPHDHRYYFPEESDGWEFIYICFHGREVIRVCNDIIKKAGPVNVFEVPGRTIETAVDILGMAFEGQISTPYMSSSLAYRLSMSLTDDLLPESSMKGETPGFLQRINDYCRDNPEKDLDVGELARIAGYSRYHFTRLFTEKRGISPGAFIRERRLARSVKMLQSGNLPIKEVSSACGFEDASYFCKAFRKAYGVSPAKFRNSGMY